MNYRYPSSRLLLFAKAPAPGGVKTRLIPHIGAAMACRLHRYLIVTLLRRYSQAAIVPVDIWYSGDDKDGFFTACGERYGAGVFNQQGDDLGQRMAHAFDIGLRDADSVMIVGADCISLQPKHVTQALAAMSDCQGVVLHPAEDGGYVSIAMRQQNDGIFNDVDCGSRRVLEQTQANASKLSIPLLKLDTLWDLDRYEDLLRSRIDTNLIEFADAYPELI